MLNQDKDLSILRNNRALAFWEILSVASSVLIVEWALLSLVPNKRFLIAVPIVLALGLIVFSHRIRGESARDLGWRTDNFAQALRLLLLPMLLGTIVVVIIGWLSGSLRLATPRSRWAFLWLPALGVAWGLLQQSVLQGFINRRAQMIWGSGPVSIFVVALTFALLHLPNLGLMLATFVGGLIWAAIYQRAPNLIALGISHCVMTWVIITTIPQVALQHLRVGYKFFG